MRDQGIILLCTSAEQALTPRFESDDQSEETLVAWATGPREAESHWRVHRIDRRARAFESIAFPGHFLRILEPGRCDVMVGFFKVILLVNFPSNHVVFVSII